LYDKSKTILIQYPAGKKGAFIIPENVTFIGYLAFASCIELTSVTIPNSVTSINLNAFSRCSKLIEIINLATTPQTKIGLNAFDIDKTACTLRVCAASVDAYRAALVWGEFSNIDGSLDCQSYGVTLDKYELTLSIGSKELLTATVTPVNTTAVTWSSDN